MQRTKSTLLLLSFGCMLAVGCDKSSPDTTPPEPAVTEPATPPPADPTPETDAATNPMPTDAANPAETPSSTGAPPAEAAVPKLADAEIAAIVKVANTGELEQAKIAKSKAKNKAVKDFAAMMVKDHTEMIKSGDAVLKKAGIEPKDNEISAHMTDEAKTTLENLKGTAKGAEFDKAYIDAQVNAHTQVLESIDKQLMPNVQNADLKAELERARPRIEAHLGQAKEIQTSLAPPTPPTT
jgi:putative membrane protein